MLCNNKTIKELLPAYQAQQLDRASNDNVEQHLASCSDCAGELALLRALADETLADPGETFWNEMPGRIYRAVQQEKAAKKRFDFSRLLDRLTMSRWALTAAAAGVVLVVSLFLFYALRLGPDMMISQSDLYSDEMMAAGSMNLSALNEDEIRTIDAWAGNELASIAQEAEPLLTNGPDMNFYEEIAVLNAGEIDTLSNMINDLEEEA